MRKEQQRQHKGLELPFPVIYVAAGEKVENSRVKLKRGRINEKCFKIWVYFALS